MITQNDDVFGSADNAVEPTFNKVFFGQVFFDLYFCALIKGTGKVPFDPAQHKPEQKRTSITLTVVPLPNSGATYNFERNLIAESKEWASIVLPSIKALGLATRDLHSRFVQIEIVPTGERYTDKQGATKEKTTAKFVQVFADETSCQAVADSVFGNGNNHTEQPTVTTPQNGNTEREVALKFLPALAHQAGKDREKMKALLEQNPFVGKYFDITSPEVLKELDIAF